MPSEKDVIQSLKRVVDPELGRDIVSLGMIKDVKVEGGRVSFTLELTTPACPFNAQIEREARQAVASIPGVSDVDMKVTARVWSARPISPEDLFTNIKNVVAIASGKGGVGKSTVAVNLALALAGTGAKVGLLDADIYGPTIPKIIKITNLPDRSPTGKVIPATTFLNVKVMSLGLFVQDDSPVIWRGPLVAGAVKQLLTDAEWGELDYLIVDLPPGTGDAPLTLAQTIPLTGVVIVTTPQEAAVAIASKALRMFSKLGIPIIGVVENMSYFECPHCHKRTGIFGSGGAKAVAKSMNVPFLGELPLNPEIREHHDLGTPIVIAKPDSSSADAFRALCRQVAGQISIIAHAKMGSESKSPD
ncbi:MAG: Mrp/NBP35 family ATP-binding protein [Aigarchaeota archaeon]|nr:Mrp/NBP35 family ATP-binding protein [Candidatus Pelearchaeum maunauluense]